MLTLQTDLEGKKANFGHVLNVSKRLGFSLGGGWEYSRGDFDYILSQEGGETIYLRLPFNVLNGVLDDRQAYIQFETPYIIKHVVNTGLDKSESSLLTSLVNQFQTPLDTDGHIRHQNKWTEAGERIVNRLLTQIDYD